MSRFIPLIVVLSLLGLLALGMQGGRDASRLKNVNIGKSAPMLNLPKLFEQADISLTDGKPTLVNFFASWCVPCRAEHDALVAMAQSDDIRIIGIAYKDQPANSRAFLDELGNPYDLTLSDTEGRIGIEFGITGVPESFIISGDGRITYHHGGPIVGDVLDAKIRPQLAFLEN